jgi:hypothetical protein
VTLAGLETTLQEARERQKRAIKALAPKHKGGEDEEFRAATAAVLDAERALAAAKGEQYAVEIPFPVSWDTGAPLPHLLESDYRAFLVFFLREIDPRWDGTYVHVRHPGDTDIEKLGVVEFERCICTKMGTPNDEVLRGHPLYGKGLVGYRAQSVENSNWLKELEAINSVHSNYKPDAWRTFKHYILPFHDSTFECIAKDLKIEVHETTLAKLLVALCQRFEE